MRFVKIFAATVLAVAVPGAVLVWRADDRPSAARLSGTPDAGPIAGIPFADYPVSPSDVARGQRAPLDWSYSDNRRYKRYKTAIESSLQYGPNFGGHLSIVSVGCGSPCAIWFIVDLKAGKILRPQFSEGYLAVRSDVASRIALFYGPADAAGSGCIFAYHIWNETRRALELYRKRTTAAPCPESNEE